MKPKPPESSSSGMDVHHFFADRGIRVRMMHYRRPRPRPPPSDDVMLDELIHHLHYEPSGSSHKQPRNVAEHIQQK